MPNSILQFGRVFLLTAFVTGAAIPARAADVRTAISSQESYVGVPVVLQIRISNASKIDPPSIPPVDGLEIKPRGTPSRATRIVTINGKTTQATSKTYTYEILPQRTGRFRIPPITIRADNVQQQTDAIEFVASKSETDDLLFAEVAGKEKQIYVGQALDLTLRIWLRPFRDSDRKVTLSSADMWQTISDRSNWGVFADAMEQLADKNQRPAAREVLRKDRAGVEHSYYLYEIHSTIYPKRPGKIETNGLTVIVDYPTALGRSRDPFAGFFDDMPLPGGIGRIFDDEFSSPFGPQLAIQSSRPVVADVVVEAIAVQAIPTAGRPKDYRGAVGQYQIATEAEPSTIKAGDPINLLIGISGTGPMELVQAPPLAEITELTTDFKVPQEPLAGFVQDDRKVFSTTIRARKEGITQIPSIPFSYFDPQQDKYITIHSKPISIHVAPADNLALDAIVGSRATASTAQNHANQVDSDKPTVLLENYTSDDLLVSEQLRLIKTGWLATFLTIPPLLVLAVLLVVHRRGIGQFFGRCGFRFRPTKRRIQQAANVAEVCDALQAHLIRKLSLRTATADVDSAIGALRIRGDHQLAVRCERIFNWSRRSNAGELDFRPALDEVKYDTLKVVSELETDHGKRPVSLAATTENRHSLKRATARRKRNSSNVALAITLFALSFWCEGVTFANNIESLSNSRGTQTGSEPVDALPSTAPALLPLTTEQKATILAEANNTYLHAQQASRDDPTSNTLAFAAAAEKYQQVVDAGVTNSRLFVNLANAYLQSGQNGKAIAYYRKSLRLDPTNHFARTNLEYVLRELKLPPEIAAASPQDGGIVPYVVAANHWFTSYVGPHLVGIILIIAWIAMWLAIGLRIANVPFPWKSITASAIAIGTIAAASYAVNYIELRPPRAVIIAPSVTLREGDGDTFPLTSAGQLREGQSVEIVQRRGNWFHVRSGLSQLGWLPNRTVEIL